MKIEQANIGAKVKYIRNVPDVETKENTYKEGEGVVVAVFLNPDRRPMVQIKEGDSTFNVDVACINPSEDDKERFKAMTEKVDAIAAEGNQKIKDIGVEYNNRVQAEYTAFLGYPLSL